MTFDDRAGKLQSENVRLIARMKGEAPSIPMVTMLSQPRPYTMLQGLLHILVYTSGGLYALTRVPSLLMIDRLSHKYYNAVNGT